jgi:hypothetical protein
MTLMNAATTLRQEPHIATGTPHGECFTGMVVIGGGDGIERCTYKDGGKTIVTTTQYSGLGLDVSGAWTDSWVQVKDLTKLCGGSKYISGGFWIVSGGTAVNDDWEVLTTDFGWGFGAGFGNLGRGWTDSVQVTENGVTTQLCKDDGSMG